MDKPPDGKKQLQLSVNMSDRRPSNLHHRAQKAMIYCLVNYTGSRVGPTSRRPLNAL
jgi:hypothetical protein